MIAPGGPLRHTVAMTGPRLEIIRRSPDHPTTRPPLLFVHGLGHGAWCWEHWLDAAARAGYETHAVSLRGHGGSEGSVRRSTLRHYVEDVLRATAALPEAPVLVAHSMGALVGQQALSRGPFRAAVLVAPVPSRSGVRSLALVSRQHPLDALGVLGLRSLPLRPSYLFHGLDPVTAQAYSDRTGRESPWAQYQITLHRPPRRPARPLPMLVLGTPDDRLVPLTDVRATARRYGAELVEFPGMGHDLMLDAGWERAFDAMRRWLDELPDASTARPASG